VVSRQEKDDGSEKKGRRGLKASPMRTTTSLAKGGLSSAGDAGNGSVVQVASASATDLWSEWRQQLIQ
jgi:hypothetical protein